MYSLSNCPGPSLPSSQEEQSTLWQKWFSKDYRHKSARSAATGPLWQGIVILINYYLEPRPSVYEVRSIFIKYSESTYINFRDFSVAFMG